jgi:hypothetical protein
VRTSISTSGECSFVTLRSRRLPQRNSSKGNTTNRPSMKTLKEGRIVLPLIWQRRIDKLTANIKRRKLSTVVEEVLAPADIEFHQSSLQGGRALKLSLGDRKQSDGVAVPVWAYIFLDSTESEQSIVFRDEVPTHPNGATVRLYSRSASSLLRKATNLRSPFCLLQQETGNDFKDGRGMICAVIAYYALIAGLNDCAIRWRRFGACIIAALEYIKISLAWLRSGSQHENASDTTANVATNLPSAMSSSCMSVSAQLKHRSSSRISGIPKQSSQTINYDSIQGGTVRSFAGDTTTNRRTYLITPAVEGRARQYTEFRDNDHRNNTAKSLVVRLQINREALAEITGISRMLEAPDSDDEEDITLFNKGRKKQPFILNNTQQSAVAVEGSDSIDSVIGDDVDSIGNAVDSVLWDANNDVVETASRYNIPNDEQVFHHLSTIRKRKLQEINEGSDAGEIEETDGHGWRQASYGRSRRR